MYILYAVCIYRCMYTVINIRVRSTRKVSSPPVYSTVFECTYIYYMQCVYTPIVYTVCSVYIHLYIHVYIHLYMHVYIHLYIHVYIHLYIHTSFRNVSSLPVQYSISVREQLCVHVYTVYIGVYTQLYAYTHVYTVCIGVYTQFFTPITVYIHLYIHLHTVYTSKGV